MARTSTDYKNLLKSLMPKGKAWSRAIDSTNDQYWHGLGEEFVRIEEKSEELLVERDVSTSTALLDEHEKDYGIENSELTDAERQAILLAELQAVGQQNIQYFYDIATNLGYDVFIELFLPFWVSISTIGMGVGDQWLLSVWYVWVYINGIKGGFNEGFSQGFDMTLPNDRDYVKTQTRKFIDLMQAIDAVKPGHTRTLYNFYGVGFDRGFSNGFEAFPTNDDSNPIQDFDYGFSQGFTAQHEYDGTYLIGGFSGGFNIGFDSYVGGGFQFESFSTGFARQA